MSSLIFLNDAADVLRSDLRHGDQSVEVGATIAVRQRIATELQSQLIAVRYQVHNLIVFNRPSIFNCITVVCVEVTATKPETLCPMATFTTYAWGIQRHFLASLALLECSIRSCLEGILINA